MDKIMTLTEEQIETCDRETLPSPFGDAEEEIERKFFGEVENPKPATEELKDVYRAYGKYVRVDVSDFLSALEAQAAELAEVRQQYVDANEARIDAEFQLAEALKALGGLLEPFEGDDCRYDHHGDCQAHFLQEGDECCVEIARRVYEGGKVEVGSPVTEYTRSDLATELEAENERLKHALEAANKRVEELEAALTRIEQWNDFPDTGQFWDDGSPMNYTACFGTNGARDFMRGVARAALKGSSHAE